MKRPVSSWYFVGRSGARALWAALLFSVLADPLIAQQPQRVLAEVRDLRTTPDDGLVSPGVLIIFHDGSFDLFDPGQPASDALAAFAGGGNAEPLVELAESAGFVVQGVQLGVRRLAGPKLRIGFNPPMITPPPGSIFPAPPVVDPLATPFVSYIGRLYPSDDLFFANDDPQRHRLFDEDGHALGPFTIDVYGQDLLDAGVRANDEQNLLWLDSEELFESLPAAFERDEEGVVLPHPGFVGSARQDGVGAGRLMSQVNSVCPEFFDPCIDYDPARIDFTRPESSLLRIQLTPEQRALHGAWSGSYYDPERAGEGFSIDFIGENPDRVVVYWYTYSADGSGEQLWLVGEGEKTLNESRSSDLRQFWDYPVEFIRTRGGRLASMDNPDTVERSVWGTGRLTLARDIDPLPAGQPNGIDRPGDPACQRLLLTDIQPLDPAVDLALPTSPDTGLPEYELQRLGPQPSGLEPLCGERTVFPFR
jgi:hypothetical protein